MVLKILYNYGKNVKSIESINEIFAVKSVFICFFHEVGMVYYVIERLVCCDMDCLAGIKFFKDICEVDYEKQDDRICGFGNAAVDGSLYAKL